MVNTTLPLRQASIPKIPWFLCIAAFWVGCQTAKPPVVPSPPAATHATVSQPKPASVKKPLPPPTPQPQPTQPPVPSEEVLVRRNVAPPPKELPAQLADWRITRLTPRDWRITPVRPPSLSDAPPSLMEDAIISSGIHARLSALPSLRSTTWKTGCNAGCVILQTAALTPNQALAALKAVIALDKIVEIRLTTTLQ